MVDGGARLMVVAALGGWPMAVLRLAANGAWAKREREREKAKGEKAREIKKPREEQRRYWRSAGHWPIMAAVRRGACVEEGR